MINLLILDPLHVDRTVFNTQNSVLMNKPFTQNYSLSSATTATTRKGYNVIRSSTPA